MILLLFLLSVDNLMIEIANSLESIESGVFRV